jgi:hypothetical protein
MAKPYSTDLRERVVPKRFKLCADVLNRHSPDDRRFD